MKQPNSHTELRVQASPALLVGIFCLMILFPILDHWVGITDPPTMGENREPAPFPEFDVGRLDPFPKQFTSWWEDNQRTRDEFLSLYRTLKMDVFGESPFPDKGVIGKDGFLFWKKYLENYRTPQPLSTLELDSIRAGLEAQYEFYAERGIRLYIMSPPAKANIYPEKLPGSVTRLGRQTHWDQILARMEGSPVPLIDLRGVLAEKKSMGRLYDRTDSHWNELGAYWAYHTLISRIREDFPEISPAYPLEEYQIDTLEYGGGNVAQVLGLEEKLKEQSVEVRPKFKRPGQNGALAGYPPPWGFNLTYEAVREVPGRPDLPRVLFLRDSFTELMIHNLGDHFEKSVFIFDSWNYDLHPEIVEQEQPDIVVLLPFEHNLEELKYNSIEESGGK